MPKNPWLFAARQRPSAAFQRMIWLQHNKKNGQYLQEINCLRLDKSLYPSSEALIKTSSVLETESVSVVAKHIATTRVPWPNSSNLYESYSTVFVRTMQFMKLSSLHMVWYPVIELYLECTIVARWQREHPNCTVILTCKNVWPARYQACCMKIGEVVPYCYWNYQWRGHNKEYPRVSLVGLNLQVSMKSPLFNFLGAFF